LGAMLTMRSAGHDVVMGLAIGWVAP
jgi:hypothetical protein